MAELTPLILTLWRTSLRQILKAPLSSPQGGMLLLFTGGIFVGYGSWQDQLKEAVFRMVLGERSHIQPLWTALFLAFCGIPLMMRGGGLNLDSITRLRRFPFSPRQGFLIVSADLVTSPLNWLLVLIALTPLPLLQNLPSGVLARPGYLIFLAICLCSCLISSFLLLFWEISRSSRLPILSGLCALALLVQPLSQQGLLPAQALTRLLTSQQHLFQPLVLLSSILFLAVLLTLALFGRLYRQMGRESGRDGRLAQMPILMPSWPGPSGIFMQKVVGHAYRGFEPYLGWLFCLGFLNYLFQESNPQALAFYVGITLVAALQAGLLFNQFGHYGNGIFRLLLFPISGQRLLLLMNLALLMVVLAPAIPMTLLAAWVWGFTPAMSGFLAFLGTLFALLTLGNHLSTSDPVARSFFSSQRGAQSGIVRLLSALVPAIAFALVAMEVGTRLWVPAGLVLLSWLLYYKTLVRQGALIQQRGPLLLERLSVVS